MTRRRLATALAAVALLTGSLAVDGVGSTQAQGPGNAPVHPGPPPLPHAVPVCPGPAAPDTARCHARVRADAAGQPFATGGPTGLNPADLIDAYKLPGLPAPGSPWVWNGQTVAIVDAFDNPNAESDLGVYRSQFGLPACTTANGCFSKVNQDGRSRPLPRGNVGWGQEIALDIQMASAVCPSCKILLVEARTNSYANLTTAVNTAARLGANAISNSWGAGEFSSETSATYNGPFNHPGVAVTASSGDSGYGVSFPAASQYVTAVGGTTLTRDGSPRGWSETVWSGAGSGCSAYVPKPSWQTDTGCSTKRTVADVAAVADPGTGVSVYDTYGSPGWMVFGGTSVASPIIASIYALAGNAGSVNYGSYPYSHTSSLNDVTTGSNGSCGGIYLCTGVSGYDGPTGLGTPNGTGGF